MPYAASALARFRLRIQRMDQNEELSGRERIEVLQVSRRVEL